jgi:hypothetical protein
MIKVILPLIVIIVALAVIGPFLTIWALNTVFPVLAIPYTMETWAAMILLGGLFKVSFRK